MSYKVIWTVNDVVSTSSTYLDVSYPSTTSKPISLVIASPAANTNTTEILTNVKFYLDGSDATLLESWASISGTESSLNGGVEISFDNGITWTRFSSTIGKKSDTSTWVILPAVAISSLATDGQLMSYDRGKLLLRVIVPPSFSDYRIISFLLGTDFDVV